MTLTANKHWSQPPLRLSVRFRGQSDQSAVTQFLVWAA